MRKASLVVRPALGMATAVAFLISAATVVSAQEGVVDRQAPGIYLKISGLEGEAEYVDHSALIDVLSLEWGAAESNTTATNSPRRCAGFRAGSVPVGDLTITRVHDAASSTLFRACAEGTHFPTVVVEMTTGRPDGGRYIRYDLQNVMITGYQVTASGDREIESFRFDFSKVAAGAIPATQRGKLDSAWDVENSEP